MSSLNKAEIASLIVAPSITGCISSLASMTLIVSILRSELKLSTVYRRLIFFLSAFDIIFSLSHLLSSLPMPAGTVWGAIGNDITCDMQGFFATFGLCCTVLYSLSLTVYFLLVVKFKMSEAKIKKRAEPFLHAVPIVYSLAVSIYACVTNNFNSAGTLCWIAPEPPNCENDPEVECLSSGNTYALRWVGAGLPILVVFLGNCTMLAVIWWEYRSQVRKNQAYGNVFTQSNTDTQQTTQGDEEEQIKSAVSCNPCSCCLIIKNCSKSQSDNQRTSDLATYLSRPSRSSVRNLEEISKRAVAYVIGFLFCFLFATIYRLFEEHGSGNVPFAIVVLARFFFPLQGLFNILIYTYPHVTSYRRNHTECNWFQAFWNVIRSGGDSDQLRVGRASRRTTLLKMQRVLAQSEFKGKRNEVEGIMARDDQREEV